MMRRAMFDGRRNGLRLGNGGTGPRDEPARRQTQGQPHTASKKEMSDRNHTEKSSELEFFCFTFQGTAVTLFCPPPEVEGASSSSVDKLLRSQIVAISLHGRRCPDNALSQRTVRRMMMCCISVTKNRQSLAAIPTAFPPSFSLIPQSSGLTEITS
ncbi:hypothetical protein [Acidomonas methanolica]|uniref:hypothetical protein n=1 Tax=Acidomonas methanolica TaxID=437 RepID=UPI00207B63A0|nr:hypothetical protein [Acidomonas methanolica]MCQ9157096.1 hypothetical protein [Acidomonas methanolica]